MSIHRLLMRLFPAFCLGKALNGNVKHFLFDLTCDVTGDLEVKFSNFIWKISSRPFHCRLNFSPTSVGFRDRWGGPIRPPPPPPPAEGRVRARPSRARVKPAGNWRERAVLDPGGSCRHLPSARQTFGPNQNRWTGRGRKVGGGSVVLLHNELCLAGIRAHSHPLKPFGLNF